MFWIPRQKETLKSAGYTWNICLPLFKSAIYFFWEHRATLHNCADEIPIRFLYNVCMLFVSGNTLPIFFPFKNSDENTLAKERKYNPVHDRCADSIRLNLNSCFNSTD